MDQPLPGMASSLNEFVQACHEYMDAMIDSGAPDMRLYVLLDNGIHLAHSLTVLNAEILAVTGRLIDAKLELSRLQHSQDCTPLAPATP